MMDLFENRPLAPMLIGSEGAAFDSPDYLYELKLDGIRCIAYLDPAGSVELLNKRALNVTPIYPELGGVCKQVKGRCILDGEINVIVNGKPNFSEVQRRALMSNRTKIRMAADWLPVNFTAFDLLYLDGQELLSKPLEDRKDLLGKTVSDSPFLAVSRVIEGQGIALYGLTVQQGLEGIVAKRKGSIYYPGKRTKDWIKCKNMKDDDFVVLGYIYKSNGVTSIILGQYQNGSLQYKGHVTLGVSTDGMRQIERTEQMQGPPCAVPAGNKNAIWVKPDLVCTVKYMELTANGSMRQPVFKGMRDDKQAKECVAKS
ncbi:MAG: DNA ligase [Desulfitobacterium hafniense]